MINSNADPVKVVHRALPLLQDGPDLKTCEAIIEAGLQDLLRGRPGIGLCP